MNFDSKVNFVVAVNVAQDNQLFATDPSRMWTKTVLNHVEGKGAQSDWQTAPKQKRIRKRGGDSANQNAGKYVS